MTKARLTAGQVVAAVFAGIFGHLLFAAGWITLGFVLLGGLLVSLLGISAASIAEQVTAGAGEFFDSAGGLLSGVFFGFLIGSLVLIVLGFLVSGLILRGGKVRRPWATTLSSVLIVAVLNLPLLVAYAAIANNDLPFVLVAVLGTLIVGILVWVWMTWGHRGPAVDAAPTAAGLPVVPEETR